MRVQYTVQLTFNTLHMYSGDVPMEFINDVGSQHHLRSLSSLGSLLYGFLWIQPIPDMDLSPKFAYINPLDSSIILRAGLHPLHTFPFTTFTTSLYSTHNARIFRIPFRTLGDFCHILGTYARCSCARRLS
jgi:hypothetical protein